jgi:hypothetical protein
MSIPGMSPGIWLELVGDGVLPDMSIPGMSAAMVGDGVLPDLSTPAMANDVGLDTSIITPKTALATARMMAEIATRRVPVMLAIEKSSPNSSCRADGRRKTRRRRPVRRPLTVVSCAGEVATIALAPAHKRSLRVQGFLISVGSASRDSLSDLMKVP